MMMMPAPMDPSAILSPGEAIMQKYAHRNDLCIKVINRKGRILSINEAGLSLLGIDAAASICGRRWADMWTGSDRLSIELSVAKAFMGDRSVLELEFDGTWEIEISPLPADRDGVIHVLAVSRLIDYEDALDDLDDDDAPYEDTMHRAAPRTIRNHAPAEPMAGDPHGDLLACAGLAEDMARAMSRAHDRPSPEQIEAMLLTLAQRCRQAADVTRPAEVLLA